MVTAVADGSATIVASFGAVRGSSGLTIRLPKRTPDPPAGQRIPMPDVRAFIEQKAAARPDLLAQSCPGGVKYRNNPWLDYIVDELRTLDTRWGYNAKPTRTPADNGGLPVIAAGDEIAYHFGPGPDQGSPDVYLIDVLANHCGNPPALNLARVHRRRAGDLDQSWPLLSDARRPSSSAMRTANGSTWPTSPLSAPPTTRPLPRWS